MCALLCSQSCLLKHFLARSLCLIVTPILLYVTVFGFHFLVLSYSGNGDGFFSSEFQSTLEGNELYEHAVPECTWRGQGAGGGVVGGVVVVGGMSYAMGVWLGRVGRLAFCMHRREEVECESGREANVIPPPSHLLQLWLMGQSSH